MLGIDTNVLVRYLVRDDSAQFERARRLFKREADKDEPVMVSLLVLLETEWVLRSRYKLSKQEILSTISVLLDVADLAFEDEPSIEHALYSWKESAVDFAYCLIEARNRRLGCQATATFDARALALAGFIPLDGFRLGASTSFARGMSVPACCEDLPARPCRVGGPGRVHHEKGPERRRPGPIR